MVKNLLSPEIIIISDDIIFARIVTTLHLDNHERFCMGIRESVEMSRWDITSFVRSKERNLLKIAEFL